MKKYLKATVTVELIADYDEQKSLEENRQQLVPIAESLKQERGPTVIIRPRMGTFKSRVYDEKTLNR